MRRQGIARGAWLITLAPGVLSAAAVAAGLGGGGVGDGGAEAGARAAWEVRRGSTEALARPARVSARPAARVTCPAPRTLRLRRFEDGSAQVLCARRVIVRVSVPG